MKTACPACRAPSTSRTWNDEPAGFRSTYRCGAVYGSDENVRVWVRCPSVTCPAEPEAVRGH